MTEKLSGEPYKRISCEEAYKFYGDEDSHFIDVRNDDEYASGHIPGSIHIPVEQFLQSIDKLPENYKSVIILRDIQGLGYEQISNIVGVPLGTVKSRINRARLQLQVDLKHYKKE